MKNRNSPHCISCGHLPRSAVRGLRASLRAREARGALRFGQPDAADLDGRQAAFPDQLANAAVVDAENASGLGGGEEIGHQNIIRPG